MSLRRALRLAQDKLHDEAIPRILYVIARSASDEAISNTMHEIAAVARSAPSLAMTTNGQNAY